MRETGKNRARRLGALALAALATLTLLYLIFGYGAYLDADLSSELTMSQHLLKKGALVSDTWYHSTELRLLDTQLVYTPLMALFPNDWRLVRTLGSVVLLALLGAASAFCARALGAEGGYIPLAAALSVSVCSPAYAKFVVVGTRYVPHAGIALLSVGLCARWMESRKRRYALLLCALLFAGCASSMRYLLTAALPLAAAALWRFALPAEGQALPRTRAQRADLLVAFAAAAAGAAGQAFCRAVLSHVLRGGYAAYGGAVYADWNAQDLFAKAQEAIRGLLELLGFQGGVPLFGAQGLLNALALLTLPVGALLLARGLRRGDGAARMGMLTLAFSFALSLATFVLLSALYFDRYWISVTALGVPVMAACLSREDNGVLRRLAALLFAGTVALGSVSCAYYSIKNSRAELAMREEACEALLAQGLTKGYATYWNANIATELSDGALDAVALTVTWDADGRAALAPYRWLEAEEDFAMDRPEEPVFLLLGAWEEGDLSAFLTGLDARRLELNGDLAAYVVPTQRALFEAMGEAG